MEIMGFCVDHLSDIIYLPIYDDRVPNCWQVTENHGSRYDWRDGCQVIEVTL